MASETAEETQNTPRSAPSATAHLQHVSSLCEIRKWSALLPCAHFWEGHHGLTHAVTKITLYFLKSFFFLSFPCIRTFHKMTGIKYLNNIPNDVDHDVFQEPDRQHDGILAPSCIRLPLIRNSLMFSILSFQFYLTELLYEVSCWKLSQLLWLMRLTRDINNSGLMYRRRWVIANENVADRWHKGMSHFERCRYLNLARFLIMWFMAVIAESPVLFLQISALPPLPLVPS